MPRKQINDYVFYKIVCEDCPDYVYVGSTVNFTKRKSNHKSACNDETNHHYQQRLYKHIRENGGWGAWQMVVIDEAKQLTLRESQAHEEKLRLKYEGNLNSHRAYITEEQSKEWYREWNRQDYEQKSKQKVTCECGCETMRKNLSRHTRSQTHKTRMQQVD